MGLAIAALQVVEPRKLLSKTQKLDVGSQTIKDLESTLHRDASNKTVRPYDISLRSLANSEIDETASHTFSLTRYEHGRDALEEVFLAMKLLGHKCDTAEQRTLIDLLQIFTGIAEISDLTNLLAMLLIHDGLDFFGQLVEQFTNIGKEDALRLRGLVYVLRVLKALLKPMAWRHLHNDESSGTTTQLVSAALLVRLKPQLLHDRFRTALNEIALADKSLQGASLELQSCLDDLENLSQICSTTAEPGALSKTLMAFTENDTPETT